MALVFSSRFGAVLKFVTSILLLTHTNARDTAANFQCPQGIFSFGTSLSDTGVGAFAFPTVFGSEKPPYGETFFGRNAYRFCDGRLVVDFFAQAFGFPLLAPFLQSIGANFRRGINFATSGATAISESPIVPFFLSAQVNQFLRFKQSTIAASQLPDSYHINSHMLPTMPTFDQGLYILSFGRNDFTFAYEVQGYTPQQAIDILLPQIVNSIAGGIQTLYKSGARNFMVFNVPAQGCSPQYLTMFVHSANNTEFDKLGCLAAYNAVIQAFNVRLRTAVQYLRASLTGSSILYFDYYVAHIAVLENPQAFGFASNRTLQACCGIGGTYNYNEALSCAQTGIVNNEIVTVGSCSNPDEYINWDGIHYTDAFNRFIAEFSLTGKFLDPPLNLQSKCNLDLSKFTGANFTEVYPNGYLIAPAENPSYMSFTG